MINYNLLVAILESSWDEVGFHEHELIESVQPDSLDRVYKADLFPEHPEPMQEETIPPWVEVSFAWSAKHELISEGYSIDGKKDVPLGLTWMYNVLVRGSMTEYSNHELVRTFQRCVQKALSDFYMSDVIESVPMVVDLRHIYHCYEQEQNLAYVQIVSPNYTDLSEQWQETNPHNFRDFIVSEFELAYAVVQSLSELFIPEPSASPVSSGGLYRSVDTA